MLNFGLFFLSAIIVMLPISIIIWKYPNITKESRLIKKAEKDGFKAKAVIIKFKDRSYQDDDSSKNHNIYDVVYEYYVNGQVYHYHGVLKNYPEEETTIYFPNGNHKKAFLKGNGPIGCLPIFIVIVSLFLVSIVYKFLLNL